MKSLHFQKTNIQFIFSMLTLLESGELQLNVFKLETCTNIPQIERKRDLSLSEQDSWLGLVSI